MRGPNAGLSSQQGGFSAIAILVFFVGIISTEAYYQEFGLKYQQLGFPTFHLMFRGIATVIGAWYLLIPYAGAILLVITLGILGRRIDTLKTTIISIIIVLTLMAMAYPLARKAGFAQARRDMVKEESTLPLIRCILFDRADSCDPKKLKGPDYSGYRHLITIEGQVLILELVPKSGKASYPPIIHLPQGDIHELQTSR